MNIEKVREALKETAMRLDILISRGDISEEPADEKTSKQWLKRVRAALRELEQAEEPSGKCGCREAFDKLLEFCRVLINMGAVESPIALGNVMKEELARASQPCLLESEIAALKAKLAAAEQENAEHDASFDLRWKSDMRAIKRWQAAHPGNDLVWPDHTDLSVWLMEQWQAAEQRAEQTRKKP